MSDLNLEWMEENFGDRSLVFFNIGCADITDDTLRFQIALPRAEVYSFECADFWKATNTERSLIFNLPYLHSAVSFYDGCGKFRNGRCDKFDSNDPIQVWNYTGSLVEIASSGPDLCETPVISLNTFCDLYFLKPDFLHIDVEGEEYNVLKLLRPDFFPIGVWVENSTIYRDGDNNWVPFSTLDRMMQARAYKKVYSSRQDTLYIADKIKVTPYREYKHRVGQDVPMTEHERTLQQRIWLLRYAACKDESWPELESPVDFFALPDRIRQECHLQFCLTPNKLIL